MAELAAIRIVTALNIEVIAAACNLDTLNGLPRCSSV